VSQESFSPENLTLSGLLSGLVPYLRMWYFGPMLTQFDDPIDLKIKKKTIEISVGGLSYTHINGFHRAAISNLVLYSENHIPFQCETQFCSFKFKIKWLWWCVSIKMYGFIKVKQHKSIQIHLKAFISYSVVIPGCVIYVKGKR
jgi:hypothetical protein